jgi:hypothetical protein
VPVSPVLPFFFAKLQELLTQQFSRKGGKEKNESKKGILQKKNGNWFIGRGVSFNFSSEYVGG